MQQVTTDQYQLLSDVSREVQARFAGLDDLAHGWEHIERVYSLALSIARLEQADLFIVGMAALLHDLGRLSHEHDLHHADLSILGARTLLANYSIDAGTQEVIFHAILAHSFSRGVEPQTLEARVVRDADRLDGLGAIGILRWAITGTIRRSPETLSYHPDDPFAEQHTPDDRRYMLDHFYTKLLKLAESMSTRTGRRLAEERTAFMRLYLDELRKELNPASLHHAG